MYHYLKWAALSLFFRRNFRYVILILVAAAFIFLSDAVYQDLADYQRAVGHPENILYLLIGKWIVIVLSAGLLLFAISRLGFGGSRKKSKKQEKVLPSENIDAIDRRLERFKGPQKLRSRSEILLEKRKKEG